MHVYIIELFRRDCSFPAQRESRDYIRKPEIRIYENINKPEAAE